MNAVLPTPHAVGLSAGELLKRLCDELSNIAASLDSSDSLTSVAATALREQDCELDADVAAVLEDHVYPAIESGREALGVITSIVERLKELQLGSAP